MKLATQFMGIPLEHPIGVGAGVCRTMKQVEQYARSAASFVVIGSITKKPRSTNEGTIYHYEDGLCSVNSIGMGNPGINWYREHLPEMVRVLHEAEKLAILSIAGDTPEEYAELAEMGLEAGADVIEANAGCPNVIQGGTHKRIISYDLELLGGVLKAIQDKVGADARVAVKLSPYSDPYMIPQVADLIAGYPVVKAIATMNTVPNTLLMTADNQAVITVPGSRGLAGMGGPAVRAIANGQIRMFAMHKSLQPPVQIVGVGGVSEGRHVLEKLGLGATLVQVTTACVEEGEEIFSQLLMQIVNESR